MGITLLTDDGNKAQKHFLKKKMKCNVGIMCLQKGRKVGMCSNHYFKPLFLGTEAYLEKTKETSGTKHLLGNKLN